MENSHGPSVVSTFLAALSALAFIAPGGAALAQVKSEAYGHRTASIISNIDESVVREFQKAWHLSDNGVDRLEVLVLLYEMTDGSISARSQGKSREHGQFTFGWTATIAAVVHTHPNGSDPKPSGNDLRVAGRFGIPIFTITQRGMYVYDPDTRRTSMVQQGLDWLSPTIWDRVGRRQRKNNLSGVEWTRGGS